MTSINTPAENDPAVTELGATLQDLMNRPLEFRDEPLSKYELLAAHLIEAGYRKTDHTEYAADHKYSDLEFQDEDGNLWTDEDEFREWFEEYGNTTLVQRHVTAWEPLA